MQPIRKKNKLSQRTRLLMVAAAAVLIIVTVILLIQNKPRLVPPVPQSSDTTYELINRQEEELLSFQVTNAKGDQFTIKRMDDKYVLDGFPDFQLDDTQVRMMVKDLTLLIASDLSGDAPEGENSLAILGLGQDAPRVTAHYRDQTQTTLRFGFNARTEIPSDFIMIEGDSKIYTTSPETRDHFDRDVSTLHHIPAINFNSDLIERIRFEGNDAFVLQQTDGWWEMTQPYPHAVNQAGLSSLLNSIGKMRFALYVSEAHEDKLVDFGLKQPRRSITFDLAESTISSYDREDKLVHSQAVPAQSIHIAIGDDYDRIGLYCLYDGKIYLCSNASMGFLRDVSSKAMQSKSPINIPINRLQRMSITEQGVTQTYEIDFVESILPNNELARDKDGNLLFDTLVYKDEQEVNSQAFLKTYLSLMGLQGAGPLPDGFAADEKNAIKTYTFVLLDGSSRELALFPFEALHYAMRVNGVFIAYVSRDVADAIVF